MAPKLLSKMTKAFMKTKRRNRKKSTGSKDKESPSEGDIPSVISTVHAKPQVICGSSYTTSCSSSGYFSSSMRSSDPMVTTTTTSKPHVVEMEVEDVTWYSSDDTGSCPSSPRMVPPRTVPPSITRPSIMRQRALSHSTGQKQQKEVLRRSAPFVHHSKSLAFRLRKRNRALSDYDFDQLLTRSRGWTFDPAQSSQNKTDDPAVQDDSVHTHHRRRALGSTDFDRYIFAPTGRSQSTSSLVAPSPCRPSLMASPRPKSEAQLNRDEAVHPFFRPEDSNDAMIEA